jgi:hypothetical protein
VAISDSSALQVKVVLNSWINKIFEILLQIQGYVTCHMSEIGPKMDVLGRLGRL